MAKSKVPVYIPKSKMIDVNNLFFSRSMKGLIIFIKGMTIFTFIHCQVRKEVVKSDTLNKVFQFSSESKQYVIISNKGNKKYYCRNEIMLLENGKEIRSRNYLKLIENSWLFTPVTQADSSLLSLLGEVTSDFYIEVYKGKDRLFGISVYFDKEQLIGIFHTTLGKLKPLRKESPCFYFKYLSLGD